MPVVELVDATAPGARTGAPTTPGPARRGGGGTRFVDVLDREWRELVESGDCADTVQMWGRRHPAAMAGCRTPDDVLTAIRTDADPVLLTLLHLAVDGDTLAGRTVVQSMLPKLITMVRRDPAHGLPDYVGWLWLVLRTYPVARRPRRVAANLALDTLKRATRAGVSREVPYEEDHVVWSGVTRAAHEADNLSTLSAARVITGARRLGLVDERTARMLTMVYDHGLPGKDAAVRLNTSLDTLRWRCSRTVRMLAAHADDLLEAC